MALFYILKKKKKILLNNTMRKVSCLRDLKSGEGADLAFFLNFHNLNRSSDKSDPLLIVCPFNLLFVFNNYFIIFIFPLLFISVHPGKIERSYFFNFFLSLYKAHTFETKKIPWKYFKSIVLSIPLLFFPKWKASYPCSFNKHLDDDIYALKFHPRNSSNVFKNDIKAFSFHLLSSFLSFLLAHSMKIPSQHFVIIKKRMKMNFI